VWWLSKFFSVSSLRRIFYARSPFCYSDDRWWNRCHALLWGNLDDGSWYFLKAQISYQSRFRLPNSAAGTSRTDVAFFFIIFSHNYHYLFSYRGKVRNVAQSKSTSECPFRTYNLLIFLRSLFLDSLGLKIHRFRARRRSRISIMLGFLLHESGGPKSFLKKGNHHFADHFPRILSCSYQWQRYHFGIVALGSELWSDN